MKEDSRLIGWLIALILALVFFLIQMIGCVSVRVVTGEGNNYEGQRKEATGVKTNLDVGQNTNSEDSSSVLK